MTAGLMSVVDALDALCSLVVSVLLAAIAILTALPAGDAVMTAGMLVPDDGSTVSERAGLWAAGSIALLLMLCGTSADRGASLNNNSASLEAVSSLLTAVCGSTNGAACDCVPASLGAAEAVSVALSLMVLVAD